jgi:hypothetical protein
MNVSEAADRRSRQVHDQGGVGFAVQDAVVFSKTSCLTDPDASPVKGRFDIGVSILVYPRVETPV